MRGHARHRPLCLALLAAAVCGAAAAAEPAPVRLEPLQVVGPSPLPAGLIDAAAFPGNLQLRHAADLEAAQSINIPQFLGRELAGVHLADAAGNPFQPDLFYRGYSVSPLLGLPQGMAVYQDGVRVNETFGDTVNWDLIPEQAVQSMQLIPGSNPMFGQNALAGALALHTKTGFDAPGVAAEVTGGSFERFSVGGEYGVAREDFALYLAASRLRESGWRDHSASEVQQLFARGTWRPHEDGQVDLTLTLADNELRGNGAAPVELLQDKGRDAVFTHPDRTSPQMLFVNLFTTRRVTLRRPRVRRRRSS